MIVFVTLTILGVLFATRSNNVGTDTEMYIWQYRNNYLWSDEFDEREPLYPYFIKFLRLFSLDSSFFLFVVAFIYVSFIGLFVKKYEEHSNQKINKYFLFLGILVLPCFLSLGINIIRQGMSIVFLLNAYNAYRAKDVKRKYLYSFISIVFHSTSLLPIILFWVSTKFRNERGIIVLYFLGIFISFLNFGFLDFFKFFPFLYSYDPRFDSYASGLDSDYIVGFKFQFILFNTCFFLIGLYMYYRLRTKDYLLLLSYFGISSFVFFMAFQLSYSDRWGIFSWIAMPLLIVPIFEESQKYNRKPLVYIFFFTIFLFFNFYKSG